MADLIKYSFAGGVFSPELYGRGDLEKYADGIGDALNWFVDYRGGAMTRPGTEYIGSLPLSKARFFSFRFNESIGNNYLLIFLPERLLFVQDGGFLVEDVKSADIDDGVVTSAAHGYDNGDLVQYEGTNYIVSGATTNTFTLQSVVGATVSITAAGTSVARVFSIPTPYAEEDLATLQFEQRRDVIFITHSNYAFHQLSRNAHLDWTLREVPIEPNISSPSSISIRNGGSGSATLSVGVVAVDEAGNEGALRVVQSFSGLTNFTTTEGSPTYYWNPVSGAVSYNVYRSLVSEGEAANGGETLGFIGNTRIPQITDVNIVPDFTRRPPRKKNPFGNGTIWHIDVTVDGSGYTWANVSVSDPNGSGFYGDALVMNGEVQSFIVYDGGEGYSEDTANVIVSGDGISADGRIRATPITGNNPSTSVFFNQALWAAGTVNNPIGLFSSLAGDPYIFYDSGQIGAASPQQLTIDTEDLTPIKHLGVLGSSLMIFTGSGIWGLYLDEQTNYRVRPQTRNGCSNVPPLFINREALFVTSDETVWALSPTNLPDYLVDNDRSLYSAHLFSAEDPIIAWCFAKNPHRVVWAVTKKGRLLSMTYVAEQNVYAWAPHNTQGFFKAIAAVRENSIDRAYVAVDRYDRLEIERFRDRNFFSVEDVWSVDCALERELPRPNATLTIWDESTLRTSEDVFTAADEGSHLRAGGGRCTILEVLSPTEARYTLDIDFSEKVPQNHTRLRFASGTWTLASKLEVVSGLDHLEGLEVEIYADGRDRGKETVQNGRVPLSIPSSKVVVGLGFSGHLRTLPLIASDAIIEHRKKRLVSVAARVYATRGLGLGIPDGHSYQPKVRTDERIQEPTRFSYGFIEMPLLADWHSDGVVEFRKEGPMAASVLGVVFDTEIGDDED